MASEKDSNHDVDAAQPLVQHLIELRSRILKSVAAILVVFLCLFAYSNDIYEFVAAPMIDLLPNSSMIATNITSTFLTPFKLTLFVSVFISIPIILWQLWNFVAPALYVNEKKIALPLFISSVVLFYAGVAFAYYIIFPLIFGFFTATAPANVAVTPDIATHLNLVMKLFFAFGIAFEIPVATILLISAGIISPKGLAKKRPYVIVACFVIGMLLTPPDVISQALLAIPMWALFEIGVFFGRLIVRSKEEVEEKSIEEETM